MIVNMLWAVCLLISFSIYGYTNGASNAIIMKRIHLALHPLADMWHLLNMIWKIALIVSGISIGVLFSRSNGWPLCIVSLIFSAIISTQAWEQEFDRGDYWFNKDMTIKITWFEWWPWLNNFLGFKW